MRRTIELSNEVAAEMAGSNDAVLRTIEEHVDCGVFLRGNVLTLDGEEAVVRLGAGEDDGLGEEDEIGGGGGERRRGEKGRSDERAEVLRHGGHDQIGERRPPRETSHWGIEKETSL